MESPIEVEHQNRFMLFDGGGSTVSLSRMMGKKATLMLN